MTRPHAKYFLLSAAVGPQYCSCDLAQVGMRKIQGSFLCNGQKEKCYLVKKSYGFTILSMLPARLILSPVICMVEVVLIANSGGPRGDWLS